MRLKPVIIACVLFLATRTRVATASDRSFPLVDKNVLSLSLPDGWSSTTDSNVPLTLTLKAPTDRHVVIQITPLSGRELNDEQLKSAARLIRDHWLKDSKKPDADLQDIRSKDVHGYVVMFADKSTKRLSNFITAGAIQSGGTTLAVRIFFDDRQSADYSAAIEMLKTFSVQAALPGAAKSLRVTSPDGTWAIIIPGDWKKQEEDRSPKGTAKQVTASTQAGEVTMSLFIEPARKPDGDAVAARDYYLAIRQKYSTPKNAEDAERFKPKPMEHLIQQTVGEAATIEYDQGDEGFKEHHLNVYLARAGDWIDLHLYKPDFDPAKDQALFDQALKGLKFEPVVKAQNP